MKKQVSPVASCLKTKTNTQKRIQETWPNSITTLIWHSVSVCFGPCCCAVALRVWYTGRISHRTSFRGQTLVCVHVWEQQGQRHPIPWRTDCWEQVKHKGGLHPSCCHVVHTHTQTHTHSQYASPQDTQAHSRANEDAAQKPSVIIEQHHHTLRQWHQWLLFCTE